MKEVIIFLDFDGVLLSFNQSKEQDITWHYRAKVVFDKQAVDLFNKLLEEYDAKIVLSTSWAKGGLDSCKNILSKNGIDVKRIHKDWITPRKLSSHRSYEISEWFDSKRDMHENVVWICLDDDPSVTNLPKKNTVWIEMLDYDCVFTKKHYNEAKKKLGKQLKSKENVKDRTKD